MYIDKLKFTKKEDILIMDDIGEIIKGHLNIDFSTKKSKLNYYEFSQTNKGDKYLLKYTFFYNDYTRVFLVDDYHIVEVKDNKIKHNDVLNASYNVFMCKQMSKTMDDISYFNNLLSNLNDKETKMFDKTLKMHANLVDFFKYYETKNNLED